MGSVATVSHRRWRRDSRPLAAIDSEKALRINGVAFLIAPSLTRQGKVLAGMALWLSCLIWLARLLPELGYVWLKPQGRAQEESEQG